MRRTLIVISIVLIGVAAWLAWESPSGDRAPRRGTDSDRTEGPGPAPGTTPDESFEVRLPDDGRPIEGTVVDEYGGLVEGIEVRVRPVTGNWSAHWQLLRRVTSADGRFRIDRVPPGAVRIHTDARFWQPVTVETEAGDTDVRIVLLDAAGEIRGTLRLPEGWKLPAEPRIQIFFDCTRGPEESDMMINDPEEDRMTGLSFRLPSLPPGRYRVRARIDGLGSGMASEIVVRPRESTEISILLSEDCVLTGLVADADGEPIAGAKVAAVDQEWGTALQVIDDRAARWSPGASTLTDRSGRYRIVGLEAATYSVAGMAAGYRFTEMVGVVIPRDGDAPDLVLGPGVTIVLVCQGVDPETISAYVSLSNGTLDGSFDEKGVCRMESVPPGEVHLSIHGPGWTRRLELKLPAGATERVIVGPPAGKATLTGRILRGDEPQPGRRLRILYPAWSHWFSGEADSEGRFRFENLPVGTATIQVGSRDHGALLNAVGDPVKLVEGTNRFDVELPTGRIRLRILDEQTGDPLTGWAEVKGHRAGQIWEPGEDLVLEDLEPKLHEIVISSGGFGPRRISASAVPGSEVVTVRMSPASRLTLLLRDEEGRPISEPAIAIVDDGGWDLADDAWDWGFVEEKTGEYRYGLARGKYTVVVGAEGRQTWKRDILMPLPGGRIEIVLRKE